MKLPRANKAPAEFCTACLLILSVLLTSATPPVLVTAVHAQAGSALDRPADPVVLTGADVPSLAGIAPSQLVAFRDVDGAWQQIPVQVDERAVLDLGVIYNQPLVGATATFYTDATTYTGPDPDPAIDTDDEIVFMAKDAGAQVPSSRAEPSGVQPGSGAEVRITDPLDSSRVGYVYLFRQGGGLDPGAGRSYVSYTFSLNNGPYIPNYNLQSGPNAENSVASTAHYRHHFSDRWIDDELNVTASNGNGTATGVDILDRHKSMYQPGDCRRTEETFSSGKGAFVANRVGPVRAIRSYMGANSGDYTQRDHFLYERRQDIATILRVHQLGGIGDFFDYSPAAIGMTYYNNLNQGGVAIDGVPETLAAGAVLWEVVAGTQGSVTAAYSYDTDIAGLSLNYYYLDDVTPADTQCTGDAYAYGFSGTQLGTIPCTDPALGCTNKLTLWRHVYYDGPGLAAADGVNRNKQANNPPDYAVQVWQPAPPTPSPTPTPTPTAPAPPSSLAATAVSSGQVKLNWTDNSGNEDGFKIGRCQGAGCTSFTQVAQVGPNIAAYSDTGVSANTTYVYRVYAFNSLGNSAYSNTAQVTAPPPPPPVAPSGLTATAASPPQIKLSWTDNATNEDGFKIERCTGATCTNFTQIATVSPNVTAYTNAGLSRSTTYRYRVRANNSGGDSAYSNTGSAKTPAK